MLCPLRISWEYRAGTFLYQFILLHPFLILHPFYMFKFLCYGYYYFSTFKSSALGLYTGFSRNLRYEGLIWFNVVYVYRE
jgi:hypothetical protein